MINKFNLVTDNWIRVYSNGTKEVSLSEFFKHAHEYEILVGSRMFLQIGEIDMWCIYGILLLIAYAGCVGLYRLWKKRKGVDSNGHR